MKNIFYKNIISMPTRLNILKILILIVFTIGISKCGCFSSFTSAVHIEGTWYESEVVQYFSYHRCNQLDLANNAFTL